MKIIIDNTLFLTYDYEAMLSSFIGVFTWELYVYNKDNDVNNFCLLLLLYVIITFVYQKHENYNW